jgi:hypothetical protein
VERPHHAGEGALAAAKVIHASLQGDEGLRRAAMTAIARHHSPHIDEAQPFLLHSGARKAVDAALQEVSLADWHPAATSLIEQMQIPNLEKHLLVTKDHAWGWWMAYFLIVRVLRLADGLSQEEER